MNEDTKNVVLYGGGTILGSVGLAWWTGYLTGQTAQFAVLTLSVGGAIYYLYGDRIYEKYKEEFTDEGSGEDGKFTEPELRRKVTQWSKDGFTEADVIKFDSGDYMTDSIPLIWENQENEELRYFFTNFGPKNQGVLIFVEAYSAEIKGRALQHRLGVSKQDMRRDPFRFSQYYAEYDRNREQRTRRYQYRGSSPKSSSGDEDEGMEVKPE